MSGPVDAPRLDTNAFLRLGRLLDAYSMHDAILVPAHESRQTAGTLTNDGDIRSHDGDSVVW